MSSTLISLQSIETMHIAILTISDTRTIHSDTAGKTLQDMAQKSGHKVVQRTIVKDDIKTITSALQTWCADATIDAIITTGGTGVTARDVTPEAVKGIIDKEIPGFGEVFRMLSYQKIKTSALQSRALAGVAKRTLIFALPGSPSACKDAWSMILQHQLDINTKPCNLAEMLPRL
ncbi:MAG: molybdenum cofactor biosynthesis protein B [Alphaproteobacteria bacterium GM202ARS2]|nr:molybdenum cofactor biosynthesis protein B [Alphaproteobacteria bacterium GM202ARS2]